MRQVRRTRAGGGRMGGSRAGAGAVSDRDGKTCTRRLSPGLVGAEAEAVALGRTGGGDARGGDVTG